MTGRRVLLTGTAGFIGGNMLARLARAGWQVVGCDWVRDAAQFPALVIPGLVDWVPPEDLDAWLVHHAGELDAIVHMGAISATTETDLDRLVRWNLRSTRMLWRHACRTGCRFLYASSAATYGDGSAGFEDRCDLAYLDSLRPLNPYGWSKHIADRAIAIDAAAARSPQAGWAGFKFFNVYGPGEERKGDMRSLVAKIVPELRAGRPIRLFKSHHPGYGDGEQRRDFIHVADVCDVLLRALESEALSGLYNVGTGTSRTFLDLVHAAAAALGRSCEIVFVPTPENLRTQYQYDTVASIARLQRHGLHAAPLSLEAGVADYVEHLVERASGTDQQPEVRPAALPELDPGVAELIAGLIGDHVHVRR